jgi:uncharacterized repeat protein (TIGR03803 family)
MSPLTSWGKIQIISFVCAATGIVSPAQTFTTLVGFNGSNGAYPEFISLVQGRDGTLYGTTSGGGANGGGTVFRVSSKARPMTLYSFCAQSNCTDGGSPMAGLVLAPDGNFYGTTNGGGQYAGGTVFKMTSTGKLTTLYSFCAVTNCPDGEYPYGGLVQALDGNFYGTTYWAGANGGGTVFKITPEGKLTTLYSFCAQASCADGAQPLGRLIQGTDGNLYGTTFYGGSGPFCEGGCGAIFKITLGGTLTTFYNFCTEFLCPDGAAPEAGLIQAIDGNYYGTTSGKGTANFGTVFSITPSGTLTTLHSFCAQSGCPDGIAPTAGLVQATDGNFYGTTTSIINQRKCTGTLCGTIFEITSAGALTTLHTFCSETKCHDGALPYGGLFQGTHGSFYGTADLGGVHLDGTVFGLSTGLGPFVTFVSSAGKVGATGGILGEGFIGTTSVSLNGTPASFTVKSDTYLTATVPTGATSGYVTVVTPTGTLVSNVPFYVIP